MNRIKELRLERQMKQSTLADALHISRQAISKYEREDIDLSTELIGRLCEIFGVTADYLLGFSPLRGMELSPEEESLILAHRRADARTRELVRLALEPFWQAGSSGTETTSA